VLGLSFSRVEKAGLDSAPVLLSSESAARAFKSFERSLLSQPVYPQELLITGPSIERIHNIHSKLSSQPLHGIPADKE
jgi:hypothetical protein